MCTLESFACFSPSHTIACQLGHLLHVRFIFSVYFLTETMARVTTLWTKKINVQHTTYARLEKSGCTCTVCVLS